MKFTGKVSSGMSSAGQSMKNSVESYKLAGVVATEEKKICALTAEIGRLALLQLDAGDQMGPQMMERYTAIDAARQRVKTATAEMPTSKVICPKCSGKTILGMQFCGNCGAPLEAQT